MRSDRKLATYPVDRAALGDAVRYLIQVAMDLAAVEGDLGPLTAALARQQRRRLPVLKPTTMLKKVVPLISALDSRERALEQEVRAALLVTAAEGILKRWARRQRSEGLATEVERDLHSLFSDGAGLELDAATLAKLVACVKPNRIRAELVGERGLEGVVKRIDKVVGAALPSRPSVSKLEKLRARFKGKEGVGAVKTSEQVFALWLPRLGTMYEVVRYILWLHRPGLPLESIDMLLKKWHEVEGALVRSNALPGRVLTLMAPGEAVLPPIPRATLPPPAKRRPRRRS